MKHLFLSLSILVAHALYAQQIERCSTHDYMQQQFAADPSLQGKWDAIEDDCAHYAATYPDGYSARAVVTIPVVFHIVYANATENVSSARIYEQLDVLNEDYRRLNTDASNVPAVWQAIAADCEIQFCLAAQDPNGNWTDGIHRVSTTVSSFNTNNNVKQSSTGGADAWDRDVYLNIWVCDLDTNLLGYAQFPGGTAATDGVVLDHYYFGITGALYPYNKGRSATHEIGHWLGLQHIWGDDGNSCTGTDNVADTPNQADEHYGCPTGIHISCANGPDGDMYQNFMDYTDDACMIMFTQGQKVRMWAVLNGSRLPLQTSVGCVIAGMREAGFSQVLSIYPSPTDGKMQLDFGYIPFSDYDITVYTITGEEIKTIHVPALNERIYTLDLSDQSDGLYFVMICNGTDRVTRRIVISH